MPYAITNESADCSGWATVDPDGDVIGCHQTKAEAIAQAVAVSLATGEEFVGERALPDLGAPEFMRDAARQGVEWFEAGLAGDGVTDETVSEARLMAEGVVSADKWVRVSAWIARHLVDLDAPGADPESDDYPSPGVVAFALWGSVGGRDGALRVQAYADGVVADIADDESDDEDSDTQDMERVRAYRAGKLDIMGKVETREFHTTIELRAEGDGNTFSGYAALFDSPSEPLPFTEVIQRGAFSKTLRARNDIKMLWNHDSGQLLASTKSGTLRLQEDERGLKVIATLPDTTAGRDARELISKGIVDAMSFGFSVPSGGDSWSSDGNTRTLKSVRLHEVSVVAWPAYSATGGTVSVRALDMVAQRAEVDADALQDVLTRIEAGAESLTAADRALIEKVLDRLAPEAEADEVVGDMDALALKKKKLDLLERF
jgi:HK97 family phage prohead protease